MKNLLAAAVIGIMASNSIAAPYIGGSVSRVNIDVGGAEFDPSIVNLHFGKVVDSNLILEGRASVKLSDDSAFYQGYEASAEVDNAFSIHAKFSTDFNAPVAPFISMGYATAKATVKAEGWNPYDNWYESYEESDSESDVIFGAGFNFNLDERASAFLEFSRFSEVNIVSFGMYVRH